MMSSRPTAHERFGDDVRLQSRHRYRGIPLRLWPTHELAYLLADPRGLPGGMLDEAREELLRRDVSDWGCHDVALALQRWTRAVFCRADAGWLTLSQAMSVTGLLASYLRAEGADQFASAVETAAQVAAEDAAAPDDGGPAEDG